MSERRPHIQLPSRLLGPGRFAREWNVSRQAIESLSRGIDDVVVRQRTRGESAAKPFQISVTQTDTTWRADVTGGRMHYHLIGNDVSGNSVMGIGTDNVAGTSLVGLADNTDYGIWLSFPLTSTPFLTGALSDGVDMASFPKGSGQTIIKGGDAGTNPNRVYSGDLQGIISDTSGVGYVWLGAVFISGGDVTIDQGRDTDIEYGVIHTVGGILSGDANNNLGTGSDGGITYDDPDY